MEKFEHLIALYLLIGFAFSLSIVKMSFDHCEKEQIDIPYGTMLMGAIVILITWPLHIFILTKKNFGSMRMKKLNTMDIAKVCHEVNRAYCAAIGDNSQVPWDIAPAWQRMSAFKGVEFVAANPDATASDTHESWLKLKEREGWKWGPTKNPEAKEHPCLLPYGELPLEQRVKDYIFAAIVRSCL